MEAPPKELPAEPGVYTFLSPADEPLYIGKARSLRKRVRSHFSSGQGPWVAEAAEILGVAEATVSWRMHEVRRILSKDT